VGAFAVPALAQDYPPVVPSINLLDSSGNGGHTVEPAEPVTVVVRNSHAATRYDIFFRQSPDRFLGAGMTDASGTLRKSVTIPSDAKPGPATLVVKHGADTFTMAIQVAGITVGAKLPRTGVNVTRLALVGLLVLTVGFGLVWIARSRREGALESAPVAKGKAHTNGKAAMAGPQKVR
jgi:hypothetical protein